MTALPAPGRPLRVLVAVDHARGVTGPHRNVVSSLNALSARPGIDLALLCGDHDPGEPFAGRTEIASGFRPHAPARVALNARLLRRAAADRDVVYVPTGLKSFLLAWAARGAAALVAGPNVAGIPGLTGMHEPGPPMTTRMASRWIEMSQIRLGEALRAGTPRGRIDLVPHAVDAGAFHPRHADPSLRDGYGIGRGAPLVVFAGHLDVERKGAAVALAAFRLIRSRHPEAVLLLLGRGSEGIAPEPGVHAIGFRTGPDYVRHIASADVFLGASLYETFWLAPLEAMACARAVVVSRAGAVPEMIPESGRQGIVADIAEGGRFRPDAAERLAAGLDAALADPGLRARLGAAARARALEAFGEAGLGRRLEASFRRALAERAANAARRPRWA